MNLLLRLTTAILLLTTNGLFQKEEDFHALLLNPDGGNCLLIVNIKTLDSAGQVAIERSELVACMKKQDKSLSDEDARKEIYKAMRSNTQIRVNSTWKERGFWSIDSTCSKTIIKDTTDIPIYFSKNGVMAKRLDVWPCIFRDLYELEVAVFFDCESGYPHFFTKKDLIATIKQAESIRKANEAWEKSRER
jgi:hypothetical protein